MYVSRKSILYMDSHEVKKFLLDSKSYTTINLSSYTNFENVIDQAAKSLEGKRIEDFICKDKKEDAFDSSYILYANKNGRYSWRPFTLIHPWLYIDLVNTISYEENWEKIKSVLQKSKNLENLECMSIPLMSTSNKSTTKAETINNWWLNIEQRQIQESLNYNVLLSTDIANCYDSIYTHSIAWALEGKDNAKKKQKP